MEKALSYIITTKNKLPYLRHTMDRLLAARKHDEEILVADAASTDGTAAYLASLQKEKSIDYYVSEPDYGESHALNKLLLQARGDTITIVTDDDAFFYPGKAVCREFMLTHPQIDVLATNGGFKNQEPDSPVRSLTYTDNYRQWEKTGKPFHFCGLGFMFRRSSLPLIGLWNPSFRRADAEYSFRLTAGKANIAWYTSPTFVNISNPQSVSLVFMKKIKGETDRLNKFYLDKNPDSYVVERLKVLRNKITHLGTFAEQKKNFAADWPTLFKISEDWLEEQNKNQTPEFLWKKS